MKKTELLEKLHSIKLGAMPTVITEDMGLQYDYICSEGAGTSFGNMGDWPLHIIKGVSKGEVAELKSKINNKTLSDSDFTGTSFEAFHHDVFDIQRLSEQIPYVKYKGLCSIPDDFEGDLYCLCDGLSWEPDLSFYKSEEEIAKEFQAEYCNYYTPWEEMTYNELMHWYSLSKSEMDGLCWYTHEREEEEE